MAWADKGAREVGAAGGQEMSLIASDLGSSMHLDATTDSCHLHPDPTPADPGCASPGLCGWEAGGGLPGGGWRGLEAVATLAVLALCAWSRVGDQLQAWGPVPCCCAPVCT
ncbi:hypothetical protein LTLLF_202910 [Microtus ochrogaster]|uniref:Uncharacterized protein n=1 Tax=Microtus ochrogaster TaxID=79684 RepID=A0A8J6FWE2_MICOH|nr:hypothetical protein LTLLF_202910 [Microtus ochrogaster]